MALGFSPSNRPALFVLVCGLAMIGCGPKEANNPANTGGSQPPSGEDITAKLPGGAEFAEAKKIYSGAKCANCHKLGDTGKSMGAPGLSQVGANADHTAKWIGEHIRDPKSHKPQSKMPMYGADKITEADLEKLSAYLAAQK